MSSSRSSVAPLLADPWRELRERGVADVADAFSLRVLVRQGRGVIAPCPACGAKARLRGPVRIEEDGSSWRCDACAESGDAVDLAAFSVLGRRLQEDDPLVGHLQAECARLGLTVPPDGSRHLRRRPVFPPRLVEVLRRPDAGELAALWTASQPVTAAPEVVQWLATHALLARDVARGDLARIVPDSGLPRWAVRNGHAWPLAPQAFRLVLPLYASGGAMESLHARALRPLDPSGRDLGAFPAGTQVGGLLLADPGGRELLEGAPAARAHALRAGVWLAAGVLDFLSLRVGLFVEGVERPLIFGVLPGCWRGAASAAHIPDGTTVTLALPAQADGVGAGIERALATRVLQGRLALRRWIPRQVG